jgi:AcrR family transcriptional regulator
MLRPVPGGAQAAKRGPGRPPDLAKRQAILEAARDVLAEVGYSSMTIDAVAHRAGSNRVLVYRVWDSKLALARDALFGGDREFVVPDSGSLVGDLEDFVGQHVDRMARPAYVKGAPGLTVELLSDPALFRETHELYVRPSEEGFRAILGRAQERGEIADGADPVLVTRVVSGAITGLASLGRLGPEEIATLVVRTLVGGLLAPASRGAAQLGDTA